MKIISKSVSRQRKNSTTTSELTQTKQSLSYCCQQNSYEGLHTTRYTKRNTESNIARQSIKDTSYIRSDLDSPLLLKDYKIQLNFKILTIGEIISEMRKEEKERRGKGNLTQRRQKIEVSLSKQKKAFQGEKKTFSAIPKLIEVQRDHPFLRNFSNKGKIVNAVQQRMEELLLANHNYNV